MSKTWKIILSVLAVVTIAAAVSYAIYTYLNKEEKKPIAFFKSKFNDDGTVEAIDATEEVLEETEAPVETTPCDDAVCAVDMCMPY